MANIAFKRGLAANLPLNSGGQDGAFYFTTDTHKLYLKDASQNALIDLTHFINYVDSVNNLPANAAVGEWYYITGANNSGDSVASGSNILAYKTATGWVQVNADTTLDATHSDVLVLDDVTKGVSVSTEIKDSRGNTASGSFSLVAGANVSISQQSGVITIAAENDTTDHKYTMETITGDTNKGRIKLTESLGASTTSAYYADIVGSGAAKVTSDSSGITIAVPEYVINTDLFFTSAGALTAEATLSTAGTATTTAVIPTVNYGHVNGTAGIPAASSAASTTAKFSSAGVMTLDVYTAGQVDTLISHYMQAADAMTYKGTIANATDLASKTQQTGSATGTYAGNVGDTYKISNTFTTGGVTYYAGDLLIATGSDGAVTYEIVKSGDSQVLSADLDSGYFALHDGVSGNDVIKVNVAGSSGSDSRASIVVSGVPSKSTASLSDNDVVTYTFSHGDAGNGTAVVASAATAATTLSSATSAGASTKTIAVVTGISIDGAGHVTTASAQNISIVDSHNKLTSADIDTTAISTSEAHVVLALNDADGNAAVGSRVGLVTSSGSCVQYTTAAVTHSGTDYAGVSIDFVWGTF